MPSWGLSPKAQPHLVGPGRGPLLPVSSHLGTEKKEEKVRKRQLSPRLLREPQWAKGNGGRCADRFLSS